MRRSNEYAVTLLPLPDSPTNASVRPRAIEKEIFCTAPTTPSGVKNETRRFDPCRSGGTEDRVEGEGRESGGTSGKWRWQKPIIGGRGVNQCGRVDRISLGIG